MKTIFTTIAIGLAVLNAATAKANHNSSALNLKMFDNGNFSVVLDNQAAYSQSGFFSANQIEPGYHKLKVIRYRAQPYGYSMMQQVIYKGWITIPPKSVVYASISCHNQFDVMKIEPYFFLPAGDGCQDEYNSEDDYGYDNTGSEGNGWNTGYNGGGNYGNNGNGWVNPVPPAPPMPMYMGEMEFMQLKGSIANKSFESSKLQIAKQALSANYFSSAQVTDLMSVFSFESTKLDFAKCAYTRVIDKQNYYLVNNAFSFESSIQDLNQYIAGR
jgi:hypothetical protein